MRKVLPGANIERRTAAHSIFDSFFSSDSLEVTHPRRLGKSGLMDECYGIHDDIDPSGRLTVVIDYNMDIGNYMEHPEETSARSIPPTRPSSSVRITSSSA
jgi:hypothetical protein